MDDFEEVEIPCFVEPKKMKGRHPKETQKNNTRKSKKTSGIAKGSKQQGNASKPAGSNTKTKTNLTKGGKQCTLLDGYEEDEDDDFLNGEPADYNNDFTSGDINFDVVSDVKSDAATTGCSRGVDMASSGVVPAKNLQRSEDGQVVLIWTR